MTTVPAATARSAWGLAAICAGLLVFPGAARAGLTLCNQSGAMVEVAVGYRSEGGAYASQGWNAIGPGDCQLAVYEALRDQYIFYRLKGPDFSGDGYGFCTQPDYFTITGDEDCAGRGYATEDFRLIDLGSVRPSAVVTLGASGEPVAPPDLPIIDLSRPFTPEAKGGGALVSGLAEGANGEPFTLEGIFQGCDTSEGRAYCAFHAEGWKFFAWDGGPTPTAFLMQLAEIPMTTSITVSGDVISQGDISVEVALREVRVHDSDPLAGLRAALQGDWVSADDPRYRMTIFGMEAFESYDGADSGVRFLQVADTCPGSAGTGPVLVTTTVPGFETQCFLVQDGLPARMDLAIAGDGGVVSFLRPD